MKLIIGLGNVGAKYMFTRHNVGFMLVDKIAMDNSVTFKENSKLKSLIAKFTADEEIMLVKPTTYMNLSGEAMRAVIDYYKISPDDMIIVYDDLSLNLGKIRFRANGSDGGHNGIKSIIQHLGSKNFARLKIGIGPQPPIPSEAFVLQNFDKDSLEELKTILSTSEEAINFYFKNGIEKTQCKYN
ncbi:TPA: aminoacyl-tRNA hydrolase [Candidatus Gastranaerophilales bacterium HUM_9]|nr:MAG TPA: aminoacyl-tRNA hydrolase [Candidatus Gastranaerophilales bacterium HUM_9]HBX34807.1 aminoacyl-tRNA hydrolase [Cyanobacteria bacterium UBA11440]